jgi:hypothetical protein
VETGIHLRECTMPLAVRGTVAKLQAVQTIADEESSRSSRGRISGRMSALSGILALFLSALPASAAAQSAHAVASRLPIAVRPASSSTRARGTSVVHPVADQPPSLAPRLDRPCETTAPGPDLLAYAAALPRALAAAQQDTGIVTAVVEVRATHGIRPHAPRAPPIG